MSDFQVPDEVERIHPITKEALYVLAMFAKRLMSVRPEMRDYSSAVDWTLEFSRTLRLDELENAIDEKANDLWSMGGGEVRDATRWDYHTIERKQDANTQLPWHDRFQEWQALADILCNGLSFSDALNHARSHGIVRIRGFCAKSAHDCFRLQLLDTMHRLNQRRGDGLPSGGDILAMLQEWEALLVQEGGALVQPAKSSAADRDRADLPDTAILVLRALPASNEPAMNNQASIAKKIDVRPTPSISSISRALDQLRAARPSLVDSASYKRTRAGDVRVRIEG